MKAGDLVQLSAYGVERSYNLRITQVDRNMAGLIVRVNENYSFPYQVKWSGITERPRHSRVELKYARI